MILHLSQMRFTLGLTFMISFAVFVRATGVTRRYFPGYPLPIAIDDASTRQIIRAQLDNHTILGENPDVVLAHFSLNVSKNPVTVREFHSEHRVGKRLDNRTFDLGNAVFLGHNSLSFGEWILVGRAMWWLRAQPAYRVWAQNALRFHYRRVSSTSQTVTGCASRRTRSQLVRHDSTLGKSVEYSRRHIRQCADAVGLHDDATLSVLVEHRFSFPVVDLEAAGDKRFGIFFPSLLPPARCESRRTLSARGTLSAMTASSWWPSALRKASSCAAWATLRG